MGTMFSSPPSVGNNSKAQFIRGCQMLNERFLSAVSCGC
jgi:hypothetical protein